MFEAHYARLQSLADAPERARELAARRLSEKCRTGHVEPTADGLRVVVKVERAFVSPAWREGSR